jgi:predicted RNA binding protein YcfA (HicA-like mRNA interferase family)
LKNLKLSKFFFPPARPVKKKGSNKVFFMTLDDDILEDDMAKYSRLPAITGKQLIKLLQKDGWIWHRRARHGVALIKAMSDRIRITIVQDTRAIIPEGTLLDILGQKQTGIRKKGLLELANKYGI